MNTSNSAKQEALDFVRAKLQWMRSEHIWPNGLRYLWTDAFGVVLLVSLFEELDDDSYLDGAAWLIADVQRVLGRQRGIRIGEEPDRDGQYFHYLAMWRGVPLNTCRGRVVGLLHDWQGGYAKTVSGYGKRV